MKNKPPVLRYVVISVLLLLLWLLQSTPKLLPELFGAKPFLLLAAALAFSACSEPIPSVIIAAVCGVLADISATGGVGCFSITFVLVCFAQASVLGTYLNRNLLTAAVLSAGSVAAVMSLYFLLYKLLPNAAGGNLYLTAYLPRMLVTYLTFFPIYGLMYFITKKINK